MTSDLVGALPVLGSIYNHGVFGTWLSTVFASWGLMNLLAIVIERRVLLPSQQYKSFYRGDLFGLPVIVAMTQPLIAHLPGGHHYYQNRWWHLGWLGIGLMVGVAFMVFEALSGVYTRAEMCSPLKIFHNMMVFPAFIYWILGCGLPGLIHSSLGFKALVHGQALPIYFVMVAALCYWANLVMDDALMSEEERAQKKAHVPASTRSAVITPLVALVLGVSLAYFTTGDTRVSLIMVTAWSVGLAFYTGVVVIDTAGMSSIKPWAHVPFHWRYAAPWRKKPWPFWTKGLPSPRVYEQEYMAALAA